MQSLARMTIALVLYLPLIALNAWGVEKVWNWYIPYIFQIPSIVFEEAIGLGLVVSFLTQRIVLDGNKSEKEYWEALIERIVQLTIRPLFVVAAAWVCLWVWPLQG